MQNCNARRGSALKLRNLLRIGIYFSLVLSAIANAQGDLHERWAINSEDSTLVVDHKPMTNILNFIAVPQDPTKYDLSNVNERVLDYIGQYQDFLESVEISQLNKDEQLAYWLNLYNVTVIKKVASDTKQARKLKKLRGTPGNAGEWWANKSVEVEGVLLSLEDIEQNILARHWEEPLFIYGLFYGVSGDGFSSTVAFSGSNVQRLLKAMARKFVNKTSNVKVKRGQAQVSSLLAWNKETVFNGSDEAMLAHIKEYANSKVSNQLADVSKISDKHKFSWRTSIYSPAANRNAFGNGSGGYSGGDTGGGYSGGS